MNPRKSPRTLSTYSPLSPSTTCGQVSPDPLACPLVTPSELTQVTDLLTLFTGVVSTTPVVLTWPTLLATPSSTEGVFVVPRVGVVPDPTEGPSHALRDPAFPSRNMTSEGDNIQEDWPHISTTSIASSSPQRDKDTNAMETDAANTVHCLGQPTAVLIEMSSPRGVEGSDVSNGGQTSKLRGTMKGTVMDSAMQTEQACFDDLGDIPSQEHSLQDTKARKRTPKRSPPAGKSKSERRHKASAAYAYGSQDLPK